MYHILVTIIQFVSFYHLLFVFLHFSTFINDNFKNIVNKVEFPSVIGFLILGKTYENEIIIQMKKVYSSKALCRATIFVCEVVEIKNYLNGIYIHVVLLPFHV